MRKNDRRGAERKARRRQLDLLPPLHEWVAAAGLAAVMELLERERAAPCGLRYRHDRSRSAFRAGHIARSLTLGGRRMGIRRPRVRGCNGVELQLPSWAAWSAGDPLTRRAMEQMLLGVSTRHYARSLETLLPGLTQRAIGRSAVSRRFITHTKHKLTQLLSQRLAALELLVLMIDGVHFGAHVVLVALGIDLMGRKRCWAYGKGRATTRRRALRVHDAALDRRAVAA